MIFDSKVVKKSRKVHKCIMCLADIPVGSIYVISPYKDNSDGRFESAKLCHECAYLMQHVTNNKFKEGNFSEANIPNFLRKIRNEYRKDPVKAWEEFNK